MYVSLASHSIQTLQPHLYYIPSLSLYLKFNISKVYFKYILNELIITNYDLINSTLPRLDPSPSSPVIANLIYSHPDCFRSVCLHNRNCRNSKKSRRCLRTSHDHCTSHRLGIHLHLGHIDDLEGVIKVERRGEERRGEERRGEERRGEERRGEER